MRRRTMLACLPLATARPTAAASDPGAQELLERSDAVRNPPGAFRVNIDLAEYRDGVLKATERLQVYAKPDGATGQYRNLVRFVEPARDRGKLMLRSGLDLWFYDPANRASVRISPAQRLLGQASNADVMTVNLAREYQVTQAERETVRDGEGADRATWRLSMRAAHPLASYRAADYWLDVEDMRPVKARFLADGQRLLKTAFYRRLLPVLGRDRPTETVIIDGLDTRWVTVMRLSGHEPRELPDAWFQRDHLSQFQVE